MDDKLVHAPGDFPVLRDKLAVYAERTMNRRFRQQLLLDDIEERNPEVADAISYIVHFMALATIPHRDPGNHVIDWVRTNGRFNLIISSGRKPDGKGGSRAEYIGLPYGTIPRMLLVWLTTEAVKTQNKVIVLGDSLNQFMRKLGMVPTGGRWGNIPRLKEQMKRLFSSSYETTFDSVQVVETKDEGFLRDAFHIAKRTRLWWNPSSPNQITLWDSTLELSEDFFQDAIRNAIPIDFRVFQYVSRCPFATDIFLMLNYKMYKIRKTTFISWKGLMGQFGGTYKSEYEFSRWFEHYYATKVHRAYKGARIEFLDTGIKLRPGRPSVSPKSSSDTLFL